MKTILNWSKNKLKQWFSLDYRSLALLRIGIGLTLIFDLIQRSEDLRVFYSDQGVLPRATVLELWNNNWWISLHMASGLAGFEGLLFIIAAIFAFMLLVGYRTQLAMIVSWFLMVSLQVRDPIILQGSDVIFRVVMFWMMFLPLGKAWSLDRLFNRVAAPKTKEILSPATIAYIAQICMFYVFTGLLKSGATWHNGTAVYYALAIDQFITPLGMLMREFPWFLAFSTYFVWYIEIYGSVLFFSPVATDFFRMLALVLFALTQIGFNAAMRLGLFGMVAIVITFGLIPGSFWDTAMSNFYSKIARKGKTGLTIYYDFDCTFCAKASVLVRRLLVLNPSTRIAPAHENAFAEKLMAEKNSWVVIDSAGASHLGWDGGVTALRYSPVFFWLRPIAAWTPIAFFGEGVYRMIARSRKQVCTPEPVETEPKAVARIKNIGLGIILGTLIACVLAWNIDGLGGKPIFPARAAGILWATHLDQKFNMFGPTPLTEDGWYVFPGTLRDGTSVDVFDGKSPVSYVQPDWIAYRYKNQRWQKYLMNLWSKDFSAYRLPYGQYLCREWNTSHPPEKQLMNFDMVFMLKVTPPPGAVPNPIVPTTIWQHHCF